MEVGGDKREEEEGWEHVELTLCLTVLCSETAALRHSQMHRAVEAIPRAERISC